MPSPHLREVSAGGASASPSPPFPAEKVTSLGKDWHRPCLRCERCGKTLTPGGHAEVRGAGPGPGRGQRARAGRDPRGALGGRGALQGGLVGGGAASWWPEWRLAASSLLSGAELSPSHHQVSGLGHGFGSLRALPEGGRHLDKEEASRESGERGVCGPCLTPPHPHPFCPHPARWPALLPQAVLRNTLWTQG